MHHDIVVLSIYRFISSHKRNNDYNNEWATSIFQKITALCAFLLFCKSNKWEILQEKNFTLGVLEILGLGSGKNYQK